MNTYTMQLPESRGTFSSKNIAVASMLASAMAATAMPVVYELNEKIGLILNLPQKSYQQSVIAVAKKDEYLADALQGVYENILSNQREFDADTKKIIYENLWDLYS